MSKTRYYFFISSFYKDAPDYMKPLAVCRMRVEGSGTYPERWDFKTNEWVWDAGVIASSGIGGDHPFEPTTEEEAKRFISEHKRVQKNET